MSIHQLDQKIVEVENALVQQSEQLRRACHVEKELQRCCISIEKSIVKEEKTKSKVQNENESLRQRIEERRKERSVFDKIFYKQECTQHRIQKDLELLLKDNKAFDREFDGSQEVNLAELEKEADMEKQLFETELMELDFLIKNFTNRPRIQEHLLKSTSDIKLEVEKTLAQEIETNKQPQHQQHQQQVVQLKRKSSSTSLETNDLDEYLEYPEETVARFIQLENENFNKFKYIETVNLDIVKLENEVEKLRQQLEAEKIAKLASDMTRLRKLAATEEQIQISNEKIEQTANLYLASIGTLQVLKNGIHNILTRIGSASKVENITDTNIMEYLGLLEQRTSEILHSYAVTQDDTTVGTNNTNNNNINDNMNNKTTLQLPHLYLAGESKDRLFKVKPKSYPVIQQEEIIESDSDNDADCRPYTRTELLASVAQQNQHIQIISKI